VGWGRVKQQTGISLSEADGGVDGYDFMKVGAETPSKVPTPSIGGAKLILQGIPWDRARPAQIAHPVGEPDVDIDRQWRALQEFDGPEIDRYGGVSDLLKEVAAESDLGAPFRSRLQETLRKPPESEIAGGDQAAAALLRSEVLGVLPAESGGDEAVKLVVEPPGGASWSADGRKTQLASQVVGCPSKIDLGALCTNGLGG